MSTTPDPQSNFTRRSEKESICMLCFLSVRADRYTPLHEAEDIHADVCVGQPGSAASYAVAYATNRLRA